MLLDLRRDAFVLDIFRHLLASTKDDHSSITLAYIESTLSGVLDEVDDILLEFLASMLAWSQSWVVAFHTARVINKRVLQTCVSHIPLQQILSSIDEK